MYAGATSVRAGFPLRKPALSDFRKRTQQRWFRSKTHSDCNGPLPNNRGEGFFCSGIERKLPTGLNSRPVSTTWSIGQNKTVRSCLEAGAENIWDQRCLALRKSNYALPKTSSEMSTPSNPLNSPNSLIRYEIKNLKSWRSERGRFSKIEIEGKNKGGASRPFSCPKKRASTHDDSLAAL